MRGLSAASDPASRGPSAISGHEVATLEIGGTHAIGGLIDVRSWSIAHLTAPHPLRSQRSARQILSDIAGCAMAVGARDGSPWGIAIPGPFDYRAGIGRFAGVAKFEALNGVDVGARLARRLGAGSMVFINDVDALLLGEWVAGSARGHRRAMAVTIGSGIGSAFLADGTIVDHGPSVPPEGRAHLLRIAGRPLEELVSRRAIRRRYAEAMRTDAAAGPDVDAIARLARSGDAAARAAVTGAIADLGAALAPWVERFSPTVIAVGGSIAASWDLIASPLVEGLGLASQGPNAPIVEHVHEPAAALIGAAYHASRPPAVLAFAERSS